MEAALREAPATLGHNNPPEPSSFEGFDIHLTDLFEEAKHFLDGSGVNSDAEAEAVSKLLDLIRTTSKDADKARAAEKKPHDDAGKAVQAKWKPLLDRADMAVDTCKRVLAPWLAKKEAEARAAAEAARKEAEARAAAAAEALVKDAKKANADANRAEKARPQAAGGARATTLRSYFTAELTDARSALAHYVATNPGAIKSALQALADTDVREGKRAIPGFIIHEEKRVV
jgi:hypothetical protein